MANTWLTPTWFTRKCLAILHAKLNFIGTINRQYDSAFSVNGAKIGDELSIRLPNQYTVRTGRVASVQASTDRSVTLTVATQKGVDVDMFSSDLALNISQEDYTERVIEPAMAVLAANVEADALNMTLDINHYTGTPGASGGPDDLNDWLDAKAWLNRELAPKDARRYALVDSTTMSNLTYGLKGLFQDSASISKQYLEGVVGRTAGLTFMENDMLPVHTNGTMAGLASAICSASQSGASIATTGWTAADTLTEGSIVKFAGCNAVHPETKVSYGIQQQFVVTEDCVADGSGNMTIKIAPELTISGAAQNCSGYPTTSGAVTVLGATATGYGQNLVYHSDAFAFVTADLPVPKGMEIAVREQYDGLSIRYLRGFDIINDAFISRLDILYGYQTLRRQLACRVSK